MDQDQPRPLDGIRVIDFTQLIAGPSAAVVLHDLGADVIKIEKPGGELARSIGAIDGVVPAFVAYNRGKRSLAVDLTTPDGRDIVRRLVAEADVLLEGFRPGVMERYGLDAETLMAERPELIYASLTAFPPGDDRPGVDAVVQAASGIMAITGERDGSPLKVGFQMADASAGLALTQAVLAALLQRERTGAGSHLRLSLFEVACFLQSPTFVGSSLSGRPQRRQGNTAGQMGYPTDMFRAADGRFIQVAAYFSTQWRKLCAAIGSPELADDPRFAENGVRLEAQAELHDILQEHFLRKSADDWEVALAASGVISSVVRDHVDILALDDLPELNFAEFDLGDQRTGWMPRSPYRSSSWSFKARGRAPSPGEHTTEVLRLAGLDDDEIWAAVESGAVEVSS